MSVLLLLLALQQPAFTLDQVMSAPFPDELVAAPAGGAVAWIFNARGARNIWVAAPPDYQGRAVTAYAEDDGQEISDLHWTADARAIVYVRGGESNRRGEYPNPHSVVKGVEQAVWLQPLSGGAPRRLGEGNSPAVSPKGDRVAFVKQGQVWWAGLGDTTAAEQLIHARGSAGSLRWSPDGSKLAFVSDRGDHAFVAVYDVAAKTLRFLDPSVDSDAEPAWSPEGDRIVFPWEKDGWTHLYSVPAQGASGGATLLTPGAFEVEHVAPGPDGATLVFSSNQDDIDRRHIWKVAVSAGPPTRVTRGTALEWAPVLTSDGKGVAFVSAGTRKPPRPAILIGSGAPRDLAPGAVPADFPEAALVDPQPVLYSAADGMLIHGQLFLPRGLKAGERRPAVIFFHGGSRRQMLRGRPDVDPKRIGLWGGSYGGFLTAMGLARASDLFAAGVDLHGVHDWNIEIENWVPTYDPEKQAEAAKLAYESSPIAHVKDWRSPVLLVHGDDDRNVQFSQSVQLAAALRAQGVAVEQLIFPDEIHDFLTHADWVAAYQAAAEFFQRRLGR